MFDKSPFKECLKEEDESLNDRKMESNEEKKPATRKKVCKNVSYWMKKNEIIYEGDYFNITLKELLLNQCIGKSNFNSFLNESSSGQSIEREYYKVI